MASKNLIRSNPFACFCNLPTLPFVGEGRWIQIFRGLHYQVIDLHLWSVTGATTKIFWADGFNAGVQEVLKSIPPAHQANLGDTLRFHAFAVHRPGRVHPVEEYFNDLSMRLMYELYYKDFQLFKNDFENPANSKPIV